MEHPLSLGRNIRRVHVNLSDFGLVLWTSLHNTVMHTSARILNLSYHHSTSIHPSSHNKWQIPYITDHPWSDYSHNNIQVSFSHWNPKWIQDYKHKRPKLVLLNKVRKVDDIEQEIGPNDTRNPTKEEPTSELGPPLSSLQLIRLLLPPSQC